MSEPDADNREQPQAWTWLARIRRPQGRKGEVFADILTDFPEKFSERHKLWLLREAAAPERSGVSGAHSAAQATTGAPARQVELTAHWLHKGGIVLHFAGVDTISAAEELAGSVVAVPRAERAPLAEDEVYVGDLIGCVVVDVASQPPAAIGEIEDVDRSAGPVALLVVRGRKGELLIPFARSYLRKIDLDSRRLEMELPEGLIDLNG